MASTVLQLLSNASATGTGQQADGGTYVWSAVGTFSSATLTLQYLADDGTTWTTTGASLTASGGYPAMVAVGDGTSMRVSVSGSPSALYSTLRRVF